jgi:hypothetical protein
MRGPAPSSDGSSLRSADAGGAGRMFRPAPLPTYAHAIVTSIELLATLNPI